MRKRTRGARRPIADRWAIALLEIWYRESRVDYAYLYTPRRLGESRRGPSREAKPEMILHFNTTDELLGIEMLSPAKVRLEDVNRVARKHGLPPVTPIHLNPLWTASAPVTGTYNCLEITYQKGRPWVGYLYLAPRPQKSARCWRIEPEMVVDISVTGALIGVELLYPGRVTLVALNRVLAKFGLDPLEKLDFK